MTQKKGRGVPVIAGRHYHPAMFQEPIPSQKMVAAARGRSLSFGGLHAVLLPRRPYRVRFAPARPVVGFAFEAQAGWHAFASDRARPFCTRPNGLAFTPPGCDVYSQSPDGGEYLTITGELDDPIMGEAQARRQINDHVDASAATAAQALRRMLLGGEGVDAAVFETACLALAQQAIFAATGRAITPTHARSITSSRLGRVRDLVEARLGDQLSVSEMAAAAGLSTGFFIRAFTAAVGQSPHRYLMARRVARARLLLERAEGGLASIAVACGFSSQAHMATVFRHTLGLTPSAYRTAVPSQIS